ncbi:MAG: hypothetical protein WCV90_03590 [Candidatus Woesearchaeota archaeon]
MKSEGFRTRIERPNKHFLASFLGMVPSTGRGGIDLLSDDFGIELKCRYLKYIGNSYACCENEYQTFPERYPGREFYWAFLLYDLSKPPTEIEKRRVNLESYITHRTVKFVPWNFVAPLPVSYPEHSGPFRYVRPRSLPSDDQFTIIEHGKSKLYLPKNTALEELVRERENRKVIILNRGRVKTVTYENKKKD